MKTNGMDILNGILKRYSGSETNVVMPDLAASIGKNIFEGCISLK